MADAPKSLDWLDEYEGIKRGPTSGGEAGEYTRDRRTVTLDGGGTTEVWVYLYRWPVAGRPRVKNGRWTSVAAVKPGAPKVIETAERKPPRPHIVTLGFVASSASQPTITFIDAGGIVLALFGRSALADDAGVNGTVQGFAGVTLAHNCASKADVDAMMARMIACGASLKKAAHDAFWGGYSGYVADPDGHLWEVAWNPFIPFAEDGGLDLPV
jgi:uncharacterized protein